MIKFKATIVKPDVNDKPSDYAEKLGILYSKSVNELHKKNLGQFFTPLGIARFMSDCIQSNKEKLRILDPGCGVGILSTSLVETLISKNTNIRTIEVVAFETDVNILPFTESCFKYLAHWLKKRNIDFTYFLCKNDFILHNSHVLNNLVSEHETYDIVISNPPYFKLPKNDERAIAARAVIHGQSNIYSIFLIIASKFLIENGRLIFITPRSFCSGNYFRLFRETFFSIVDIKLIHLFNSRKDAFKKDKVLQENVIMIADKKSTNTDQINIPFTETIRKKITISSSNGIGDIATRRIKEYESESLINYNSRQKILHLPASEIDEQVIDIFKNWTGSLSAYELEVSTGPVVDFRSEDIITANRKKNSVPLIWLNNVEPMKIVWPKNNGLKGKPKGQFIDNGPNSLSRLIPNKNYVLLRRFSAKDDNRRLIAAPYFDSMFKSNMLGVENHLNYIYHKETVLSEVEATGLSALLNSQLFDIYFRTFNGNINVSATELRDFPLPDFGLIQTLGKRVIDRNGAMKAKEIDPLVADVFNLNIDLSKIYG